MVTVSKRAEKNVEWVNMEWRESGWMRTRINESQEWRKMGNICQKIFFRKIPWKKTFLPKPFWVNILLLNIDSKIAHCVYQVGRLLLGKSFDLYTWQWSNRFQEFAISSYVVLSRRDALIAFEDLDVCSGVRWVLADSRSRWPPFLVLVRSRVCKYYRILQRSALS